MEVVSNVRLAALAANRLRTQLASLSNTDDVASDEQQRRSLLDDVAVLLDLALHGGANVDAMGGGGGGGSASTPLIKACTEGVLADVKTLVALGAEVTLEGEEWKAVAEGDEVMDFPLNAACYEVRCTYVCQSFVSAWPGTMGLLRALHRDYRFLEGTKVGRRKACWLEV
jgi:hypothetical protein